MAAIALLDAFVATDGYDYTGDLNSVQLTVEGDVLPATPFRSTFKRVIGGLKQVSLQEKGFWSSAVTQSPDSETFPQLGQVDKVFTVGIDEAQPTSPVSISGSEVAYMFKAGKFAYEIGDQVGTVAPFTLAAEGTGAEGVVRGIQIRTKSTVAATGQLGATLDTLGLGIPSGWSLFTTFHCFVPATTITVQVQSDDNTGFSSPTTIGTIGPITTSSGTWLAIAGPVTDRYFRLNVSAITGTFTVAAAMGLRTTT